MIRQSLFYNTCIHSHTTDQFTNIIEPFIEEIGNLDQDTKSWNQQRYFTHIQNDDYIKIKSCQLS